MEISTGMSSTFVLVVSEATTEILLMVISAVAWMYSDSIRKCIRKLVKSWNFSHGPLAVKLPKRSETEDAPESEGSSSEPEPEDEVLSTQNAGQMSAAPSKRLSPGALDLSQPEIQNKVNGSRAAAPQALQPQPQPVSVLPPGLERPPGLEHVGLQARESEKVSKRKKNTAKPKPQPEVPVRELGRCVCWKESFGFIVDETGARLFVRQVDVEGEKVLLAGQVVWFRRGGPQPGQTPKAIDVGLVDIEIAKILRSAEKDGIKWSTFQKAVLDGDSKLIAGFKSLQSSANCTSKLASFKAEAVKGTKEETKGSQASGVSGSVSKAAIAPAAITVDKDLKAFLGSGSIEQMRANLKYAPQWVTDKFNAQYGIAA